MRIFDIFRRKTPSARHQTLGASRRAPLPGLRYLRAFAAAEVSRTLANWIFDGGFSNGEIGSQLPTIRSRSRERQKNDEYIANFIRLFRNNVVGRGFTLRAQPSIADDRPEIDNPAKKFLQYHFWKWAKSAAECDAAARLNLAAIFRLMATCWARDGEAVAILERSPATKYGLRIHLARPDALDETANKDDGISSTIIRNGVEIDRATRRPVAYWFRSAKAFNNVEGAPARARVPASEVIHLFSAEDPAQTRGVPLTHAALKKSKMLDDFNNSELVAALDETNTIGTFKDKAARDPATAGLQTEDDSYSDAEKAAYTQKSEPGTKLWLDGDIDFEWHSPNHPNREVTPFKKTMLRDIACGLGVDYNIFANDLGEVNFSSIRAGTIAMRDHWRVMQDEFISLVVSPVYEAWLAEFLKRDLAAPYQITDYARLAEHEFQGRTWEWVDPMKDINAAVIAVQRGWKTNEEITAQYGGADFLENCERLKIENDAAAKAGLSPSKSSITQSDEKDE